MDVRKQLNKSKNAVDLRNTSKKVRPRSESKASSEKTQKVTQKKSSKQSPKKSESRKSSKSPLGSSRKKAQAMISDSTSFLSDSLKKAQFTPPPMIGLLITAGFLIAFLGATFAYFSMTEAVPTDGGQLSEGVFGSPTTLNPLYATSNPVDNDLTSLLYPQLFVYDSEGNLQPELAQEQTSNPEKTSYRIVLKENVAWDDGTPITVDDVLFTIEKIKDPNLESPLRPSLSGVEAVRVDDRTIELNLNASYSPFISTMTFGILPKHIWEELPASSYASLNDNLNKVSAGPFTYRSHKLGSESELTSLSLEKNPGYFGDIPRVDRFTFQFYDNPQELIADFENGVVDSASYITLDEDSDNVQTQFIKVPQYFAVFFNTKNPFLKNPVAREALSLSFNKDVFIEEIVGEFGERLDGPLTQYNTYFDPNEYEFNPERARQILEEDGWVDVDGDGIREKDNVRAEITLTAAEGDYVPEFLQQFQSAAREIGVSVLTNRQTLASIQENSLPNRSFDALYLGIAMNIYPDPYIYWHSSQGRSPGLNLSQYTNVNADGFLESARTNTDESVIASSLTQFQQQIAADNPALFLYTPNSPFYVRDYVENIREADFIGNTYSVRYLDISNWTINTTRVWK